MTTGIATGPDHRRAAAPRSDAASPAGRATGADDRILRIVLGLALVTLAARAAHMAVEPMAWVGRADNDDIMRLLSVRTFLDGQVWFDMRQYRLLPPDGLDMHWSRYIDAAIAGLIGLFGLVA
nr:hypothetical protein [Paracoccaceae bacterium]